MIAKKEIAAVRRWAAEEMRAAGEAGAETLADAADAALVELGRRAEARIQQRARSRKVKRALKAAGKAALAAGAAVGAVVALRAARRRPPAGQEAPKRRQATTGRVKATTR